MAVCGDSGDQKSQARPAVTLNPTREPAVVPPAKERVPIGFERPIKKKRVRAALSKSTCLTDTVKVKKKRKEQCGLCRSSEEREEGELMF